MPDRLVQSGNLELFIAVQWEGRQGEPRLLNASCSADPREWRDGRIRGIAITGGELRGIRRALIFDRVVVLVLVVVVTEGRATMRVAEGDGSLANESTR